MAAWIDWKIPFNEDMKIPGFKEEFDREYEEFCKQNDAELVAERMHAEQPRPVSARSPAKREPRAFSARLKRVRTTA